MCSSVLLAPRGVSIAIVPARIEADRRDCISGEGDSVLGRGNAPPRGHCQGGWQAAMRVFAGGIGCDKPTGVLVQPIWLARRCRVPLQGEKGSGKGAIGQTGIDGPLRGWSSIVRVQEFKGMLKLAELEPPLLADPKETRAREWGRSPI